MAGVPVLGIRTTGRPHLSTRSTGASVIDDERAPGSGIAATIRSIARPKSATLVQTGQGSASPLTHSADSEASRVAARKATLHPLDLLREGFAVGFDDDRAAAGRERRLDDGRRQHRKADEVGFEAPGE